MIAPGTDSSKLFAVAIRWPWSVPAFPSGPDTEVGVKSFSGGGGGIRTPETLSSLTVFKAGDYALARW